MNGWVTIGTKLDKKQLEKDIKNAEKELQQYEKEAQKLTDQKAQLEAKSNIKEVTKEYQEAQQEVQRLKAEIDKIDVSTDTGMADYHNVVAQYGEAYEKQTELASKVKETQANYNAVAGEIAEIDSKLAENQTKQEGIKANIGQSKKELAQFNAEIEKSKKIGEIKNSVDSVRNSMTGIVKKAVHWGIAIFGIRSAYNFLRSSISTISQYNKQVATDIDYIRFALASTLEPVVIRIISLVKTLLGYIGYIAKAWFGVDLFAGASVDKFKQGEKALGGASKQAKELNKQLAGFDEMNVLQDNADTGGGGGGGAGGGNLPSFDLSAWDGEIPDWLKWIADNKDLVLSTLAGIAAGLLAIKFGLSGIQALGIGIAVAGIVYTIQALLDYLKDPTWDNFSKIIFGIGVTLVGLGVLIGGIPVIIAGVIIMIVAIIIRYWEQIKSFLTGIYDWLMEQAKSIGGIWGFAVEGLASIVKFVIDGFNNIFNGLKKVLDGIIKLVKGVINGDINQILEGLKDIVLGVLQGIFGMFELAVGTMWSAIRTLVSSIVALVVDLVGGIVNIITGLVKGLINLAVSFVTGIFNVLMGIGNWIYNNITHPIEKFFTDLWNGIVNGARGVVDKIKNIFNSIVSMFRNIGTKVGNAIGGAFKGVVNGVLGGVERILNSPIRAINGLISTINKVPGVNISRLSTFSLPRLAKGGIINQPGRGVAIGGERGPEGVIPLTDSQQMAMLGEAIGKYITVNASITNTMNGRVISRELKQIQNENDFAYNR